VDAGAFGATVPTIDQSLGMQAVSGAEISPDGKYIAYLVQQASWDENDRNADLDCVYFGPHNCEFFSKYIWGEEGGL
jgi:hypothetical protein